VVEVVELVADGVPPPNGRPTDVVVVPDGSTPAPDGPVAVVAVVVDEDGLGVDRDVDVDVAVVGVVVVEGAGREVVGAPPVVVVVDGVTLVAPGTMKSPCEVWKTVPVPVAVPDGGFR
jgi:hypothetical protein